MLNKVNTNMHFTPINKLAHFFTLAFTFYLCPVIAETRDSIPTANSADQSNTSAILIRPSSYISQFAGSIGLIAIGAGWEYGKRGHWATDFLIGYVPKYDTDRSKITLTLRQGITPWSLAINENFSYQPLRTGLYLSTTIGKKFWFSAPEKYPSNYYTFSTRIRPNIYLGQSFSFHLPKSSKPIKVVDFYYDLHTNDFMLISKVQNKSLKSFDYLGIALGLKLKI